MLAAEANRLERLRNPSHGRTLTAGEIRALLTEAGVGVTGTLSREHRLDLEDWMNRSQTPPGVRDAIRERIGRELAGGEPTGLRPDRGLTRLPPGRGARYGRLGGSSRWSWWSWC